MNAPAAIKVMRTYGVSKSVVHHIAVNNFVVHPNYTDCFDRYFLLYWSGAHVIRNVIDGAIEKDGISYIAIYKNVTRGEILANPSVQFALSFRKANDDFQLPPYVLIS